MKLEKILENVNSLEKNPFLKVIDNIKSCNPKNNKEIDKILSDNSSGDLKSVDSINIARVFNLVKNEFAEIVKAEFVNTSSQLDILIDILIRDGNGILKQPWLSTLYERELTNIRKKTAALTKQLSDEKSDLSIERRRDYGIYKACVETAYVNDTENNRENKISNDELTILLTLARKLELSQEEVKLINYLIVPPVKLEIDSVIASLKNIGVVFFSKKSNTVFVADEVVTVLRKIRKKEIADKHFRRVLKTFREPQINLICRKHNIDFKELTYDEKIKSIITEGISVSDILAAEIHKEDTSLTDKKKAINEVWEKGLRIESPLRGSTVEEKINHIIDYFNRLERDDKVGISVEGYEKLLLELNEKMPVFKKYLYKEFELHDDFVVNCSSLLDLNIKPRDILDIIPTEELKQFAADNDIKQRGDLALNILDAYKDAENLLIENYEAIGFRDLATLKENGIMIKESEIGLKFEDITKTIFEKLGFFVDEDLKKTINTANSKCDIILNLGNNDVIIVECKTVKESGYNKFSAVSRQIKSYIKQAQDEGLNVVKSLLVAPDFSDDFINDCDLEFEINLSLITASALNKILEGFKNSKLKQFPHQLLLKDVLIKEERILKAISK